jgi:alcohol dehydrogenase class IV
MKFEFATAGRITFGPGTFLQLKELVVKCGSNAFVITGKRRAFTASLFKQLSERAIVFSHFEVSGEPDTDSIMKGLTEARQNNCNVVVAVGGGSVVDTGKAIAALIPNEGDLFDYLEVVGKAKPLTRPKIPLIAVPTTAGTGAEVTSNAVILSRKDKVKVSLRHPAMFPTHALIDPELTYSLPKEVTAGTGLDALTQLIEPFVSCVATPYTDALCRDGIARIRTSLPAVYNNGADTRAREQMCLASLAGGIALANAKLGAVHGIAGPLGGLVNAPHGELCAALLPAVMEINIRMIKKKEGSGHFLEKYKEIARILTGASLAEEGDGITWVKDLCAAFSIKRLGSCGLRPEDISTLTSQALKASSMKGNPVVLGEDEIREIIEKAY